MRRIAIFAHYDPDQRIKGYVVRHLLALREVCAEVHFVSTAGAPAEEMAKLDGIVASCRLCENLGYDFGMWQRATQDLVLGDLDELVLTNSSVFGPIFPLAKVFDRMQDSACDFWGLSDNLDYEYHLQSYFIVLRRRLLRSGHLERFFASVLPYQYKHQVIRSYEVGLTHYLLDQGFVPDVVASVLDQGLRLRGLNPALFAPMAFLDRGVPYVKVELLRDNPHQIPLAKVRARMAALGYPMNLVEVEPQPRRSTLWGSINRLRFRVRRWCQRKDTEIPLRPLIVAMIEARRRTRLSRPAG